MLTLSKAHLAAIASHGEREYPDECCGLLIGRTEASGRKTVMEILRVANPGNEGRKHDRSLITPQALMSGEKYARSKQMDVIGNYHSHPDWPATPSQFDLEHAWPTWSYIIVSIPEGKATDIFSWELEPDRSKFNPEELITLKED